MRVTKNKQAIVRPWNILQLTQNRSSVGQKLKILELFKEKGHIIIHQPD